MTEVQTLNELLAMGLSQEQIVTVMEGTHRDGLGRHGSIVVTRHLADFEIHEAPNGVEPMTEAQRERAAQFCTGYRAGLANAHEGTEADVGQASEQYRNGYRFGHRWGTTHPAVKEGTSS